MNPSLARHRHVDNPAAAQSWPVAFPVQKMDCGWNGDVLGGKMFSPSRARYSGFFFSDYRMAADCLTIFYCLKKKRITGGEGMRFIELTCREKPTESFTTL